MANRDLTVRIGADASGYDREVAKAAAATRLLERETRRQEARTRELHQAYTTVGTGLAVFGAAALAATGLAVKAAIDWESAWAGVTKTVDGSAQQMAALEGELRKLATELPASHQQIAAVAEAAGQLGIQRGSIVEFTETMIALGETTNLSAEEAATALARFSNVMGTSQSDVDRLGAAIVDLGNNSATTEAEIVEMAQRLAGAGNQIGLTEGEVLGFAAALSSVGIEAQAGGSAFSRVMINIEQAARSGGDELETFAAVSGVTAAEFQTAYQQDAGGAIITFIEGLGRMQSRGEDVFGVLDQLNLGEIRVRDSLLRAAGASDLFTDSLELGNTAFQENTALVEEARQRYETTASQIEVAKNNVTDFAIDVGETFVPIVGAAANKTSAWIGLLRDLPGPLPQIAGGLGAVAGGASLLGGLALLAVPKVHEFRGALDAMGGRAATLNRGLGSVGRFLMGPWGVALAAGAIALGIFVDNAADARQRTQEYKDTLDETTGALTRATAELAVQNLVQDGVADSAERLGLGFDTLVRAILGEQDAIDDVNTTLDRYQERVQTGDRFNSELAGTINTVRGAIDGQSSSLRDATEDWRLGQEGMAGVDAVMSDVLGSTEDQTGAQDDLNVAMEEGTSAADELKEAFEALTGANRSVDEAQLQWLDTIQRATDAISENGAGVDLNTQLGRDNRSNLLDLAEAAEGHIVAMVDEGRGYEEVRGRAVAHRDELIRVAREMGFSEEEARRYVDRLFQIPNDIETIIRADTGPAQENINRLVRGNDGRLINIVAAVHTQTGVTTYRPVSGGRAFQAEGGILAPMAAGGLLMANGAGLQPMSGRVADVVDPNTWRIIGDRMNGRESFIPHDGSARSLSILEQTAREMGFDLVPLAEGGLLGGLPGGTAGGGDGGIADPGDATGAFQELTAALVDELMPALEDTQQSAGEDTTAAIDMLTKILPVLSGETTKSSKSVRGEWDLNTGKTQRSTEAMSRHLTGMQRQSNASWADIRNRTGQAVNTITGPQFGGLHRGMDSVQGHATRMADWVGGAFGRIPGLTGDPIRWSLRFPINRGLVPGWNAINSMFQLNKHMNMVPVNFAEGSEDHRAQIANPGQTRVWNEPETEGEAYIPLAGAKRGRSTDILAKVAHMFGYALEPQFFADGGLWRSMFGIVRNQFPSATLNSAYRPGDPGFHGSGRATDLGGPMAAINRWLAARFPNSTELIYTPGINLYRGRPHTYNAGTRADHYDHVHWAMNSAAMLGNPQLGDYGGAPGFDFAAMLEQRFAGARRMTKDIRRFHGNGNIPVAMEKMSNDAIAGAISHAQELMATSFGPGGGGNVERWRGVGLRALGIAGQAPSEIGRLLMQMRTESGGDPNIVNRWDSNWIAGHPSVGLMQVIGPTYRSNRHPQFDFGPYSYGTSVNPLSNILASIRYTLGRYGSLAAGWRGTGYRDGGVPTRDGFGYLHAGERVLSTEQRKAFDRLVDVISTRRAVGLSGIGGGDGAAQPLVGALTVQTTERAGAQQIIGETMHQLRVARRRGRP